MKEQKSIPTSKISRASKLVGTGAKMGGNYIKYLAKSATGNKQAREDLDKDNAEDVYNSLSQLKGSALKVAQIMSMDKNFLPTAYADKFSMAQYSAPPLSYPLVVKTFRETFGKSPDEMFDTFTKSAVNAASIGQVHKATKDGKDLAVKVQYPGVAKSVQSDLKMVKPIAKRILKVKEAEIKPYLEEVEEKLLEETDYELELRQSVELSEACANIDGLVFPKYYKEYSGKRVITMDWITGMHLKDYIASNPSQAERNNIGQKMWDFYDYQINTLLKVHADPHPGNFLITKDVKLGIIDFGCVKVIPEDFHKSYFKLLQSDNSKNDNELEAIFYDLNFLYEDDTEKEKAMFFDLFKEMINLLARPFHNKTFDFGDDKYFEEIYKKGEEISNRQDVRNSNSTRGPKHALYINRTYFGLYSLLNQLGAEVRTS